MIDIRNISLSYGRQCVLSELTMHVPEGGRIALMGPSGCGKTTLLRMIAGLARPDSGAVSVSGRISFVFQEPRLFPWLTAEQNISTVLGKSEQHRASELLISAGLAECSGKYPDEMSGGQQQRVSILRALAAPHDILLLDEPLKGLDEELRAGMLRLITDSAAGKTIVAATHDVRDASGLGASVYEYRSGRFILQST